MTELFKAFAHLQYSSTKKAKKDTLIAHKDDTLFTDTLKWLLSPVTVTGINSKKLSRKVSYVVPQIKDWSSMMTYLNVNNTGKGRDIAAVNSFIDFQPKEEREFYKLLITRRLKIGVDVKTVNSVYGKGFIPCFEVQLANKYFDNPDKVTGEFTITEKLDGVRMAALIDSEGNVRCFTRQGREILKPVDIIADIKSLGLKDTMLDGEIVLTDYENISSKDNYRETMKIVGREGEKHGIKYMAFDILPLSEFTLQECKLPYSERRKLLNTLSDKDFFAVLPTLYSGTDKTEIAKWLAWAKSLDKEGVMINLNEGVYEFKRTNQLLKVKTMSDADLLVVDVYPGIGKYYGELGGIVVEFIHEGNHYRCKCGSGFSDAERKKYWKNPQLLIGKIVTIQYFEITQNANGGYGLRFPVWISRIREDKTEISMN